MRILLTIAIIMLPLIGISASNNFFSLLSFEQKIYKSDLDCFQTVGSSHRSGLNIQNELNPIDTEHRINSVADVNFVKVLDTVVIDSQYRMIGEFVIKTEETTLFRISDVQARKKIKLRALKKAQQIAAIMGGELVHVLNYRYSGGGYSSSMHYTAGNKSQTFVKAIPNELLMKAKVYSKFSNTKEEGLNLLKDTNDFEVICEYFLRKGRVKLSSSVMANEMHIDSINMLGGLVYLYGRMTGTRNVNCFRLVSMNEKYFYLYYTRKERHYQIQVRR